MLPLRTRKHSRFRLPFPPAAEAGVGVSEGGAFAKSGGTIYGDTDTTHTSGSTENTSTNGNGHAVLVDDSNTMKRNSTADAAVKLYAKDTGDTWTYDDPSTGGLGDTSSNWNT
jgi:hypothetical protein